MLHISKHKLKIKENYNKFKSVRFSADDRRFFSFNKFIVAFLVIVFVIMFLPWTQFVTGNGNITTLRPDQRPQTIQSAIAGRVEKWYVQEGDYVKKGDTILFISEIVDAFFDPLLLERTDLQVTATNFSYLSLQERVDALNVQLDALQEERDLKLEQARNRLLQANLKVMSDSIELVAAQEQVSIAKRQLERVIELEREGLKAVTDVEDRNVRYQLSLARVISQENNLLASKNEVLNARIDISSITANYKDRISLAESNRLAALSSQLNSEADLERLKNTRSNIKSREDFRWIKAPQDGFINRAIQRGIGETFQAGAQIASIMPANAELAVETFVEPIDLPLVHVGEKVRIIFDGWPFIFFSGWPNLSYGTFGGQIVAVENFISDNGKYRVLIAPDKGEEPWPKQIQAGTGARTFALLNNVPVWYELWRQVNGFPQDYYTPQSKPADLTPKNQ